MKNINYQDQDYGSKPLFQSGFASQLIPPRNANSLRQYSVDKNLRRISPAPQERFSQVPNQVIYQIPVYSNNDYQIASRLPDLYSAKDNSKVLQDIFMRIEKMQLKSQKIHNLQTKICQIQTRVSKFQLRLDSLESKKQQYPKGKENSCASLDNKMNEEQFQNRQKTDYVSRDELQRHLIALDAAFKTHLGTFKTVLNTQMSQHNIKNKRKFIEITAAQLNQKLQQFRSNFAKQWQAQLQNSVKQAWNKQYVGKSAIGLSKNRFIGSVVPLKLRQQLNITLQGVNKQLQKIETLYFLDKNGYLLDKNMFYLLDKNNKQIRLADEKLEMLKKEGILSISSKQLILAKDKTIKGNKTA